MLFPRHPNIATARAFHLTQAGERKSREPDQVISCGEELEAAFSDICEDFALWQRNTDRLHILLLLGSWGDLPIHLVREIARSVK